MTKTDKYRNGVIGVTFLSRAINPEIGSYQEHYLDGSFTLSVKLTNGAINISEEVAHDYEVQPSSLTPDRIKKVANTFRKKI